MSLTLLEQDLEATYSQAWLNQVLQQDVLRYLAECGNGPDYELGSEGDYRPYKLDRQGFLMEAVS